MENQFSALYAWYQTSTGQEFSRFATPPLEACFVRTFGYYLVQAGLPEITTWTQASPIQRHFALGEDIAWNGTQLPLRKKSIDCFFLPHTLEHVAEPNQLLAEVRRVLLPGGKLIVMGFNPTSFWGIQRYFNNTHTAPWSGCWLTNFYLRKLLINNGFTIIDHYTVHKRSLNIIFAEKRTAQVLPIRPMWRIRDYVIGPVVPMEKP